MVTLNKLPSAPPASHTHSHDTDLTGVSADDHHAQAHASDHTGSDSIEGLDFTITGNWDVSGITGRIKVQTGAGAPSHTEAEGTPYWDTTNNKLYVNNDGGTSWTELGAGGGGSPHALLDGGTAHTDTTTDTVSRGSIVVGNSTPAWDELVLGASGTILASDGTDLAYKTAEVLHIIAFTGLAEDLASGVLMPRPGICVGESGEHGTYTGIRGKAIAGTAGTGTNTILIEADDNPAFSSAVTLFTLALDTSTEVDDTTLDTSWASGDIFVRARCSAVGATAPKDVTVFFYYQEALLLS